jgi:hypothetical protein
MHTQKKSVLGFLCVTHFGLILCMCSPMFGQVAGATLSSTVSDPSGAIVGNAQISIKNLATDITTVVIANADGFYSAPNLVPGDYEASASSPGFSTEVPPKFTLIVRGVAESSTTIVISYHHLWRDLSCLALKVSLFPLRDEVRGSGCEIL